MIISTLTIEEGISGFFRSSDFQSVQADARVVEERRSSPKAIMMVEKLWYV